QSGIARRLECDAVPATPRREGASYYRRQHCRPRTETAGGGMTKIPDNIIKLAALQGAAKPELIVNESDPTATATELAALFAARGDFLFNGHTPVRVAAETDNLPRAIEVTTEAVRVYAHKLCRPVRMRKANDGTETIPTPLSRDIAQLYLNGLEGTWGLKNFRGITTSPILKGDGSIRIAAGYDRETGLWCHNIPDLIIPEQPTATDARAALHSLREFFRTFPY